MTTPTLDQRCKKCDAAAWAIRAEGWECAYCLTPIPTYDQTHSGDCWKWHPECAKGRIERVMAWLDRAEAEIEASAGPTATTVVKHTRRILWGMG
jgi:hypothetical protein